MSINLPSHYVIQYSTNINLLLQEKGSKLRPYVTEGSYVGKQASPVDQFGAIEMQSVTSRFAAMGRVDAAVAVQLDELVDLAAQRHDQLVRLAADQRLGGGLGAVRRGRVQCLRQQDRRGDVGVHVGVQAGVDAVGAALHVGPALDPAGLVVSLNVMRRRMGTTQRAIAGARLNIDFGLTQDDASKRVGVSKVHVNLVVQALKSKNARLIKLLEDPGLTREQLHEELVDY